MKSTSLHVVMSGMIAALGCGLVHCSAESVPSPSGEASGGTGVAGAQGGSAGTAPAAAGTLSTAGSSLVPSGGTPAVNEGGTSSAGSAAGGSAGGLAHAGTNAGGAGNAGNAGAPAGSGCLNGAILCEDFEQFAAASAPGAGWTASQRGNGKIVVDTTRAFSGKQSLHVTGKLNADRANISKPIQTDSLTAYVKFMLYTVSYPASSGVHSRLMRIGTTEAASGNPETSYSLATYNGTAIEKVNSIYRRDTGTKLNDASMLNAWKCMEFAIDGTGGAGKVKVQLWVDGRELTLSVAGSSSHGMTPPELNPIPFQLFMLGLDGFQADAQPADFWIDDISVTAQRIGCKVTQ